MHPGPMSGWKFENRLFFGLYISISLYIIIFRVILDIITLKSEWTPVEVASVIFMILTTIVAFIIHYENKVRTHRVNRLYSLLFLVFLLHSLGEAGLLIGRESLPGYVLFGSLAFGTYYLTLEHTYPLDKAIFFTFFLGVLFLLIGFGFDSMEEGRLPFELISSDHQFKSLFEEVPELFSGIFFLHSMCLLYRLETRESMVLNISRNGWYLMILGGIFLGTGSSNFQKLEHRDDPTFAIMIGIILCITGILILLGANRYFMKQGSKNPEPHNHGSKNPEPHDHGSQVSEPHDHGSQVSKPHDHGSQVSKPHNHEVHDHEPPDT